MQVLHVEGDCIARAWELSLIALHQHACDLKTEYDKCYDPACMQSIWCRILDQDGEHVLSMNVRFRSNDAYKAAFMNSFALVQLQQRIAQRIVLCFLSGARLLRCPPMNRPLTNKSMALCQTNPTPE